MKIDKSLKFVILYLLIVILFYQYNLKEAKGAEPVSDAESPYHVSIKNFPAFELPALKNESEKSYLGHTETGNFNIGQIKAKVLIIELFSFYCPHCQRAAPKVNELYQEMQKQDAIKEKIKIIGIGVGNSDYEVNSFKNTYQIPFPLFPDKSMGIFKLLQARSTPTFIGIKVNENGSLEQFYLREGGFDDIQKFLAEIIKLSGMESGDKNEQTKK
ncbi:MAG: redoxin domain-containing protein [Desulfobacterium sp.]|nr:redoxin domain-containing protein [Desulfobacterium sp.]MBU3948289.1 redoxin domain-containing protein [Pseudomonadota bacterium]MBU4034957.1 redoxin domain-containing protein [Pseudomonadota bacterium]